MDRRAFVEGCVGVAALCALGGVGRAFAGTGDGEAGGGGAAAGLLRPPGGQDVDRFLGACVRCDRCRSACPQGAIRLASLEDGLVNVRTPVLDFTRGLCEFCDRCSEWCPAGALRPFDPACDRIGVARLAAEACVRCGKCVPACAYEALTWDETAGLPVIDEGRCNGCGACEFVCPSDSFGYYQQSARRAIYVAAAADGAASEAAAGSAANRAE